MNLKFVILSQILRCEFNSLKGWQKTLVSSIFFQLLLICAAQAQVGFVQLHSEVIIDQGFVRVAAFDADETLRSSTGENPFPLTIEEQMLKPGVAQKLKSLTEAGYFIAIFSNQGSAYTPSQIQMRKKIFESLRLELKKQGAQVHYIDFASFYEPHARKPKAGMWLRLSRKLAELGLHIDKMASFMVGDSGFTSSETALKDGHSGSDFSNNDRKFAMASGISFYHAKSFFNSDFQFDNSARLESKLQNEISNSLREISQFEAYVDEKIKKTSVNFSKRASKEKLIEINHDIDQLNLLYQKWFLKITLISIELYQNIAESHSSAEEFSTQETLLSRVKDLGKELKVIQGIYKTMSDSEIYEAFFEYVNAYQKLMDRSKMRNSESKRLDLLEPWLTRIDTNGLSRFNGSGRWQSFIKEFKDQGYLPKTKTLKLYKGSLCESLFGP